jgi:ABC-type amino acid transport substrate-binding protein
VKFRGRAVGIVLGAALAAAASIAFYVHAGWIQKRAFDLFFRFQTITIGVDESDPPFTFYEDGYFQGFAVDLIYRIADDHGLHVAFVPFDTGKENLYEQLMADRVDAVLLNKSLLSRGQLDAVETSVPFFVANQSLIFRADEPFPERKTVKRGNDVYYAPFDLALLNHRTIGVEKGTLGAEIGERFCRSDRIRGVFMSVYEDTDSLFRALLDKEVFAIISDELSRRKTGWPLRSKIKVEYSNLSFEEYVFAVKKDRLGLRYVLYEKLERAKQDGVEGAYAELYYKWFQ